MPGENIDIHLTLNFSSFNDECLQNQYIYKIFNIIYSNACVSVQYVSLQTSMPANEVQIWAMKDLEKGPNSIQETKTLTPTAILDGSKVHPLEENHTLGEIHNNFSFNQGNLVITCFETLVMFKNRNVPS